MLNLTQLEEKHQTLVYFQEHRKIEYKRRKNITTRSAILAIPEEVFDGTYVDYKKKARKEETQY